jgi:hypothetical protein
MLPTRMVWAKDERGREQFVGDVPYDFVGGVWTPMALVPRGLLPPKWMPATIVRRDGQWLLEVTR